MKLKNTFVLSKVPQTVYLQLICYCAPLPHLDYEVSSCDGERCRSSQKITSRIELLEAGPYKVHQQFIDLARGD